MAGSQSISKAFFTNLLDKKKSGDDVNKSLFKLFEKNDPKLEGTLNDVPKWTPPVVATPKEDDSQKQKEKKATKGKKAEKEESSEVAKKDNTKQQPQKNGKDAKKETKKEEKKETKKDEKNTEEKEKEEKTEKAEENGEAKEEDSDEEAKAEKLERPPKRQRSKEEYQRTIAINNVPETIKKQFLSKLFGKYGGVESVRLWTATSGGFIVMDSVAGAQKAVSEINGMEIKGQELSAMIHTGPEKNPQKGAKKPQKGKPSLSSPSPNKKNSSTPTKKFSTPQKSTTPTRTPSTPKTPGTAEKLKNFGTLTKKAISNTLKRKDYRTPSEKASPKADTTDKRPIREVSSASPPAKKRQYVKVVNKNAKKSS